MPDAWHDSVKLSPSFVVWFDSTWMAGGALVRSNVSMELIPLNNRITLAC